MTTKKIRLQMQKEPPLRLGGWRDDRFAKLVRTIVSGDRTRAEALSSGIGSDGGFLVPEETANRIASLRPSTELSVTRVPVGADTFRMPTYSGILKPAFRGPNTSSTSATFTLSEAVANPKVLDVYVAATDELWSDVDLSRLLAPVVARGFSALLNEVVLTGNGTTEPEGVLVDGGIASETVTNTDAASVEASIEAGLARISPGHRQWEDMRAAMNSDAFEKLRELGLIEYIALNDRAVPHMAGTQVVIDDSIETSGGSTDIAVGDWSAYAWAEVSPIELRADSGGQFFEEGKTALRWSQRVDGTIQIHEAFVKLAGLTV